MSKLLFVASTLLVASATFAQAYQDQKFDLNSLSGFSAATHPGVSGDGATGSPKAKPSEGSLSGKEMRDHPGNRGGSTANPLAKPIDGSLSGKAMRDHPGNT